MLVVEEVHTFYGESHVLHGVSLTVPAGAVTAVLGRNGMGKTTLVRSIVGFTPPRRGRVLYRGREIQALPPYAIAHLGVGLVPQGRRIFPSLTVEENLQVAARRGEWTLNAVYTLFPRLRDRRRHRGGHLSGGEQQMLAIGRALMGNPALLLMDEPSEGLAPLVIQEVETAIRWLREQGLGVLLVEQNLPLAMRAADYVYVLSKGTVAHEGPVGALRDDPKWKAQHIGV